MRRPTYSSSTSTLSNKKSRSKFRYLSSKYVSISSCIRNLTHKLKKYQSAIFEIKLYPRSYESPVTLALPAIQKIPIEN
jgi:hypothetical protein